MYKADRCTYRMPIVAKCITQFESKDSLPFPCLDHLIQISSWSLLPRLFRCRRSLLPGFRRSILGSILYLCRSILSSTLRLRCSVFCSSLGSSSSVFCSAFGFRSTKAYRLLGLLCCGFCASDVRLILSKVLHEGITRTALFNSCIKRFFCSFSG